MRKTGGRTAAVYAAMGLTTWGLSEILGWIRGSDIDVGDLWSVDGIDQVIDTGYDLGQFDAAPEFSADLADQFENLPEGTTHIKVNVFAGVDGTPATSATFNMNVINGQVDQIKDLLATGDFSKETIDSVNSIIDSSGIKQMVDYAVNNGADEGNRYLFTLRNLEGIYETLKQVDGKNELKLDFSFDDSNSVIGDESYMSVDRFTGVHLETQPEEVLPPDTSTDSLGSWRAEKGVYNEDNTHKGQEK